MNGKQMLSIGVASLALMGGVVGNNNSKYSSVPAIETEDSDISPLFQKEMCDRFDFSYLSDEAKKGFMDSLWEINKTQVGAELLSSLDKSEKILLRQDEKQDCAGYYSPDFNILSISAFPLNAEVLFHELVHAREDSEFKIQSGDLEKMKSDIDVTNTLAELFARVRSCRFVTEYNSNSDKKIEPWIKKRCGIFSKSV